jgi:ribonuclease-3 family protein
MEGKLVLNTKICGAKLPSVAALSYIGDAVHSLYVRRMLVTRGLTKSSDLNREALRYVTAEAQAAMYEKIAPLLTEDELDVFRRASNSTHLNRPKHASGRDYRFATGFEAVIGMLEWTGNGERLEFILNKSHIEDDENDSEN